jgi:hypothetical protein
VHLAGRDGAASSRKTSPFLQTSILLQNTHNQHIEHSKQAVQGGAPDEKKFLGLNLSCAFISASPIFDFNGALKLLHNS